MHVYLKFLQVFIWALFLLSGFSSQWLTLPSCQGTETSAWTNCIGVHIQTNYVYVGEWQGGSINGYGTVAYSDGDKYVGKFKGGKSSGLGILTYANGNKYIGEYKNGLRNGQGAFSFKSGAKYVGEFVGGDYSGHGMLTYANGDKYVGEFKDSDRSGQGTLTYAIGDKFVGKWEMDVRSGHGTFSYANGSQYIGDFKDDMRNGQGTLSFANGDRYVGEFKNGKRHGRGTIIFANGDKYFDDFRDGPDRQGYIGQLYGDKATNYNKDKLNTKETTTQIGADRLVIESNKDYRNLWASEDSFVFVTNKEKTENHVWWHKNINARPNGKTVFGVAISDLNSHINLQGGDGIWCFANTLTRKSFTSPDQSLRAEIDETMWDENLSGFQASGAFTGQGQQDAVVGIFEDCNGLQGNFILITDRSQPKKIVYLKFSVNSPAFVWIKKSKVGDSLILVDCLGCGSWSELSYDVKRKRFYWIMESW